MSEKFQNKYRSESHRHPTWDYSANGMYFITLVTQNRDCIFGKIENDAMQLNNWGKLVETEWYKSFEIRTELFCNEFILMPNHLHAIVIIDKTETHYFEPTNENKLFVDTHGVPVVDTHGLAYLPSQPPMPQRKTKSISSFVAGFKSSVTTPN